MALDKENENDCWWKTIQKEISALKVAFKNLDDDDKPPTIGPPPPIHEMPHGVFNQDGGFLQESTHGGRWRYG